MFGIIYPRQIDNSCKEPVGGGGGAGPPGPPGPPGMDADSICTETMCLDFEEFALGDVGLCFDYVTVTTDNPGPNPLMIFDADAPTGGDFNLGTPNAFYAGPGVGAGGGPGAGQNDTARGKILIISENANPVIPVSKAAGGVVTFTFDSPVNVMSIQLIDVDEVGWTVESFDKNANSLMLTAVPNLGTNSFQEVSIMSLMVKTLVVTMGGKGAIAQMCYERCKEEYKVEIVQLPDNAMTNIELQCPRLTGSYFVLIDPILVGGATASFTISKAEQSEGGAIKRLANSPSATDEQVHMDWDPNMRPQLYHRILKSGGSGALIGYKVKVFNV